MLHRLNIEFAQQGDAPERFAPGDLGVSQTRMTQSKKTLLLNYGDIMKNCKSCKKEIDVAASKCPFCQSYQTWYKSPQIYSFLFIIPIIGFSFWNIKSLDSKNYTQYKDKISFEILSNRTVDKNIEFIYKVKNSTEYKWDSIKYQMVGYDNTGKIITTKNGGVYEWLIQAHSESLISIEVPYDDSQNIKTWKFEIVDLRTSRF